MSAPSTVTQTPATARDLEYRVSSPGGPPKFTAGPWSVKKLHRNDSDVQNAYLVASDPAEVTATWTDDEGPQKRTWLVPFLPGSKG